MHQRLHVKFADARRFVESERLASTSTASSGADQLCTDPQLISKINVVGDLVLQNFPVFFDSKFRLLKT